MSLAQYEDLIDRKVMQWYGMPMAEIMGLEERTASSVFFERAEETQKEEYELSYNQLTDIFIIPKNWHRKAIRLLKQRLGCELDKLLV